MQSMSTLEDDISPQKLLHRQSSEGAREIKNTEWRHAPVSFHCYEQQMLPKYFLCHKNRRDFGNVLFARRGQHSTLVWKRATVTNSTRFERLQKFRKEAVAGRLDEPVADEECSSCFGPLPALEGVSTAHQQQVRRRQHDD